MEKFLKRFFGFSLGPVLGALISFVQVPVLTYFLTVDEYGLAGAFQTLLVQIPNFIYIGLDQAYTREYHRFKDKRYLAQQAMLVPMLAGVLLFVCFIVFDEQLSLWLFDSPHYQYIAWYAGVWVLATVIERFMLLTIRMEERAFEYSLFNLTLKLGVFLFSMLCIAAGMRDFRVIVYGLIFGQLLVDLILFWRYRYLLKYDHFRVDQTLIQGMLKFGVPVMVAASLTSVLNSVDMLFLTEFSTPVDRGIYSVAFKISSVIGILKTAFASFWTPTAYRWHEEGKSLKHYKFISDALLMLLTAVFFALLLVKKSIGWILDLAYDEVMYGEVIYIVGLLCLPHIMYTLSETTTLGIVFSRKTHYNIVVSILALLPSLILNYILTPTWGYRGAALASAVAYIIFYFARTLFSRSTGFYFQQKKQVVVTLLMFLAAFINAFKVEYIEWITLGFTIMAFVCQLSTFKDIASIRNNSDEWDFS